MPSQSEGARENFGDHCRCFGDTLDEADGSHARPEDGNDRYGGYALK